MDQSAFNLSEEINNRKVEYILHKSLWDKFNSTLDLAFTNWEKIKYLNVDGTSIHADINKVPNNKGGIYLFFLPCSILTGVTDYPLYIGRAQLTANQNLRKRVKEYFQKYAKNWERPKIHKMLQYWGKDLHLAYYPLNSNQETTDLEKDLINALLLPMNELIPDKIISTAQKAFK